MRNKQPLLVLKNLVKSAPPARDFKGAIMQKAAETGNVPCRFASLARWCPAKP